MKKNNNDEIVFSYTMGEPLKKFNENSNKNPKYLSPDDFVRIRLEKNNRGGKLVTTIFGFKEGVDIETLCSDLKKRCGSGGTVKEDHIEIQGDKKDIIEKYLIEKGFKVKKI
ncbi:MAG: hypothetical protein A2Z98_00780 [Spirochaetes bacterium GWB1_27_13]|nr:MAG: hypothetical protein A2Z98_00780 [Spirochaetes bacterium GWB1_27_13]